MKRRTSWVKRGTRSCRCTDSRDVAIAVKMPKAAAQTTSLEFVHRRLHSEPSPAEIVTPADCSMAATLCILADRQPGRAKGSTVRHSYNIRVWNKKKVCFWYWCYYPHTPRDSLSPVCIVRCLCIQTCGSIRFDSTCGRFSLYVAMSVSCVCVCLRHRVQFFWHPKKKQHYFLNALKSAKTPRPLFFDILWVTLVFLNNLMGPLITTSKFWK